MTLGKSAHLTAAIDHAESDGKVVPQSDAFVSVPKDLLQLVIERGRRGDPRAPQLVARGTKDKTSAQLDTFAPRRAHRRSRSLCTPILLAVDYVCHAPMPRPS